MHDTKFVIVYDQKYNDSVYRSGDKYYAIVHY
jgi:hypothetical protein